MRRLFLPEPPDTCLHRCASDSVQTAAGTLFLIPAADTRNNKLVDEGKTMEHDTTWDLGSIIGVAGIVVGALVALLFYLLSRRRSKLMYKAAGVRLIGEHGQLPEDVQVTYLGAPVQGLTNSTVVIWNGGNDTLEGTSLLDDDPLRLEFDSDAMILNVEVLKCSRSVNHFSATVGGKPRSSVVMRFSFLDPGDGATLRVLHTGQQLRAAVKGTIKGMPKDIIDAGRLQSVARLNKPLMPFGIRRKHFGAVVVVAGIVLVLMSFIPRLAQFDPMPTASKPAAVRIAFGIAGLLYIGLGVATYYPLRRRYPITLVVDDWH